jgi:hypothetical protein
MKMKELENIAEIKRNTKKREKNNQDLEKGTKFKRKI